MFEIIFLILAISVAPWLILAVLAVASWLIGHLIWGVVSLIKLLFAIPLNIFNNILNNSKEKETQKQEELRQQEIREQEQSTWIRGKNFIMTQKKEEVKELYSYTNLYKGASTLIGKRYKFIGKIIQINKGNTCYIEMYERTTYKSDAIILIYIIGTPSEILMVGDTISFIGLVLGNHDIGMKVPIPCLEVYASELEVIFTRG